MEYIRFFFFEGVEYIRLVVEIMVDLVLWGAQGIMFGNWKQKRNIQFIYN